MNKNIKVIIKIGHYDYKAASNVIKHFNEMIDKFIRTESKLIKYLKDLKPRDIGYSEAKTKCINACKTYKTKTCVTMKFDTGVNKTSNAAARPKLDDLQLTSQFKKNWIWYKATNFVRRLVGGDDVMLAAATQEE